MPDPIRLELEFLKYEHIADRVDAFLKEVGRSTELPVDVDAILEFDLRIDLVPHPALRDIDTEAFLSSDLKRVYFDEWVFKNVETRSRFSLAHEIGHFVLHREVYEQQHFDSKAEWKAFYLSVDPEDYEWLERQANNFAGLLLVPRVHLAREFRVALADVMPSIEKARGLGFNRQDYLEIVRSTIARCLSPVFNVSPEAVRIRIQKDGLDTLL